MQIPSDQKFFFVSAWQALENKPFWKSKSTKKVHKWLKNVNFSYQPCGSQFLQKIDNNFFRKPFRSIELKKVIYVVFWHFFKRLLYFEEKSTKIRQKSGKKMWFFPTNPVDRTFYKNWTRMFLESLSEVLNSKNSLMWHFDTFSSAWCIFRKILPKLDRKCVFFEKYKFSI